MSADNGQNEVLAAFMDEMKSSMADVEGVDDFTETARRVVWEKWPSTRQCPA